MRWPSSLRGMWTTPGMWASMYSSGSLTSSTAAPLVRASAKVSMSTSGASGWVEGVLMTPFLPPPAPRCLAAGAAPGLTLSRFAEGAQRTEGLRRRRRRRAVGLLEGGEHLLTVHVDAARRL